MGRHLAGDGAFQPARSRLFSPAGESDIGKIDQTKFPGYKVYAHRLCRPEWIVALAVQQRLE